MATSKNVVIKGAKGSIGKELVFRQRGGKTVISAFPSFKEPEKSTEAQHAWKTKFFYAVSYGKQVNADPVLRAAYEKKAKPGVSVFNLAIKNYLKPPVVGDFNLEGYTGAIGDSIKLLIVDIMMEREVFIAIKSADGTLIEEGNAVMQAMDVEWIYTATQVNPNPETSIYQVNILNYPKQKFAYEFSYKTP